MVPWRFGVERDAPIVIYSSDMEDPNAVITPVELPGTPGREGAIGPCVYPQGCRTVGV